MYIEFSLYKLFKLLKNLFYLYVISVSQYEQRMLIVTHSWLAPLLLYLYSNCFRQMGWSGTSSSMISGETRPIEFSATVDTQLRRPQCWFCVVGVVYCHCETAEFICVIAFCLGLITWLTKLIKIMQSVILLY